MASRTKDDGAGRVVILDRRRRDVAVIHRMLDVTDEEAEDLATAMQAVRDDGARR